MSDYEDGLFDQIIKASISENMNDEKKTLILLNTTHSLLKQRSELFGQKKGINLRDTLFRSYDVDLLDGRGNCGSYSFVLAKLLKRSGIKTRIGQLKCDNGWACHIIVEAKINDKWIVLDPLFNIIFKDQNNQMVGFKDLKGNFDNFKSQVPKNYPDEYDYDDIRYTNWDKIPFVSRPIKTFLTFFLSNKNDINEISLRLQVMNLYKIYLITVIVIYFIFLIFTSFKFKKNL